MTKEETFETALRDHNLAVFPHFKTSTFGFCIENKIPFIAFRDPYVSISPSSLKKMRELGGVVDMQIKNNKFIFSKESLLEQINKVSGDTDV